MSRQPYAYGHRRPGGPLRVLPVGPVFPVRLDACTGCDEVRTLRPYVLTVLDHDAGTFRDRPGGYCDECADLLAQGWGEPGAIRPGGTKAGTFRDTPGGY